MNPLKITKIILCKIWGLCITLIFLAVTPLLAGTYYISPNGSDSANGQSEGSPLATFDHAYDILTPGDTLILLDGAYNQQLSPSVSGDSGAPITFMAKNRGKAIIQMVTDGNAILVYSTTSTTYHHLHFDGLIARSQGEYAAIRIASADNVSEDQMTNNITVRNTGAFGSANLNNVVVFDIGNNLRDSLFEDIWAYGFGRKALQVFGSLRVTIRRAVLRYDYWDGGGYKPNDPRSNFSGYNTVDSIFENIIAIDSAPTPPGRSADRSAFTSSGNETPALISGSARNKYRGLLSLDNYGNGIEVNGGTGSPNHDNSFENLIFWNSQYYGFHIHGNDAGSSIQYITAGHNGLSGIYINLYPSVPITDVTLANSFSINNGSYGILYDQNQMQLVANNSATGNTNGGDLEPENAPSLPYLVKPEMVAGKARGATLTHRYVDGEQTSTSLWPWPNEALIKQHMCDTADLAALGRIDANGTGWEPKWCQSNKSLTTYIWEYLGTTIPPEIYGQTPQSYTLNVNSSGASWVAIAASPAIYADTTNYSKAAISSGTGITLTAPASSGGKIFRGWTGCDSSSTVTCTLSMTTDKTVTANYKMFPWPLFLPSITGGTNSKFRAPNK
ncbi:MAG: right-handed parallel beta-helix repeat-containing protein [Pseudomonadota bacterium]